MRRVLASVLDWVDRRPAQAFGVWCLAALVVMVAAAVLR